MSGEDNRIKIGIERNIATLFRQKMTTLGVNSAMEAFLRGESLEDFMSSSAARHIFTAKAIEMIKNREFPEESTYKPEPNVPYIQTEIDTVDDTETGSGLGLGKQIVSTHQKEDEDEERSSRKLVRKTGGRGIIIPSDC